MCAWLQHFNGRLSRAMQKRVSLCPPSDSASHLDHPFDLFARVFGISVLNLTEAVTTY